MAETESGDKQDDKGVPMTVDEAISEIMACRADATCNREEACFMVATALKELLDQSRAVAIDITVPDEVAHYAPGWETARPDRSAA